MKRLRWMLLGVAVLLLGSGGVAAWAYAHRGYPYVVYYQRLVPAGTWASDPGITIQEWIDPQNARSLTQWVSRDGAPILPSWPNRAGQPYAQGRVLPLGALSAHVDWQVSLNYDHSFLHGFSGEGRALLASAVGPVSHIQLHNKPALRFKMSSSAPTPYPLLYWLDARTLVPLQEQAFVPGGLGLVRFAQLERLAPYTLPANFFDPPNFHPSLWDRATGWAHDRLGLAR